MRVKIRGKINGKDGALIWAEGKLHYSNELTEIIMENAFIENREKILYYLSNMEDHRKDMIDTIIIAGKVFTDIKESYDIEANEYLEDFQSGELEQAKNYKR